MKNNKNNSLEGFHNEKKKDNLKTIQLTKCNLKMIKTINFHKDIVYSATVFPSGNIISVSKDCSIIIHDINYNMLQYIQNAHNNLITYVEVKDDNNFVTCSFDRSIKTWIKYENKFIINKIIVGAHNAQINKVIYFFNDLISCSCDNDRTVKIWQEMSNNYQLISSLKHDYNIWSILFLKDKNILVSSGEGGTNLWNIKNLTLIKNFSQIKCRLWNAICRLDNERIIIGGGYSFGIISLSTKIVLKEIQIPFVCLGIKTIEEKGIFFIGGESKNIFIYRNDNYKCIETIYNAHDDDIDGFIMLKNNLIASYSMDSKIKIWSF